MFNENSIRLRACRKRYGLDQAEIALLVGRNQATVSRFESGRYLPDSQSLVAYEILFDMPASTVLPHTRRHVTNRIQMRARHLLKRCEETGTVRHPTKVEFLEALLGRLTGAKK